MEKYAWKATIKRWDEYISDILIMEKDPKTGAQPLLKKVFSFE